MRPIFPVLLLLACARAQAATLDVALTDASGHPAANAVVLFQPHDSTMASHVPDRAVIDQRRETFLPLVVVVRRGGNVVFTNNDTTKHQVYSFSAIKQFEFVIKQGETSPPIIFPQPGISAIGCNIHDQMIAYVLVSDAPYAAVTDAEGRAVLADLPAGQYWVVLWHPQMGASLPAAQAQLDLGKALRTSYSASLPVTIRSARAMKPMHMDY
ncbi:MAG: methylamine utilization protein [Alphaproteobacteria bacterium]|nr:methylamine utilization protein [Alphaproteobacteria bacterium]